MDKKNLKASPQVGILARPGATYAGISCYCCYIIEGAAAELWPCKSV